MASIPFDCQQLVAAVLMLKTDTYTKDNQRLAAKVYLTTKIPTLALEDIDQHLSDVTCLGSLVTLSFATAAAKQKALQNLALQGTFYLITSHSTCNENGERTVYL